MDARSQLEAKKRSLLSSLERALLDALAESPEVHRSIWRLQRAGFTLQFAIECREASADGAASPAVAERPDALAPGSDPETGAAPRAPGTFRIDAGDLRFLRSIGIDPTRRTRARRRV
ncbi:MAG: hypothetical protein ACREI7_04235 [Myxococcota bacterium]